MDEQKEIAFLCSRLKELREKNACTMDDMTKKIKEIDGEKINKSSLSRAEAGKTTEKTAIVYAEKYCRVFGMSEEQIKQFLRGIKIAIPDTSVNVNEKVYHMTF